MRRIRRLAVLAIVVTMLTGLVGCAKKENATEASDGKATVYKTESYSAPAEVMMNAEPMYSYDDGMADLYLEYEEYESEDWNTEEYNEVKENSIEKVQTSPLSTFAIDVDTGSYTNFRRMWREGAKNIPSGAIRTEEFLNYFDYDMGLNVSDGRFTVTSEIHPCPWNNENGLLSLLVTANPVAIESQGNNIVFLVDSSGSMGWGVDGHTPIELAVESLCLMVDQLTERDKVSIVTYAGDSRTMLSGCKGSNHEIIKKYLRAIDTKGGTNGSGGITAAYKCAVDNYIEGGNNRVILASDGDMNLGITSQAGLIDLITEKKELGVFLTTLGFGEGNYSDANMERIADAGNGNYFYIDCIEEAQRVLVDKMMQTTVTVAKDVKLQAEFNPNMVSEYRLIGYENRTMADADFSDDTKDGGEVGAGDQVMVLYEIKYASEDDEEGNLEYQTMVPKDDTTNLLTMSIRYKEPDGDESTLEQYHVTDSSNDANPSGDWKFAAGIAAFTGRLRGSSYFESIEMSEVINLLKAGTKQNSYREELVRMVEQ